MKATTAEAESKLDEGLQLLLQAKTGYSDLNVELIDDFAEILPNTQIGSQGNTDFYSFVVSPIWTVEVGEGSQSAFTPITQKGIVAFAKTIPTIIYSLAFAFVATAGIWYGLKKFRNYRVKRAASMDGVPEIVW